MSRFSQLCGTPGARIVTAEMPLFDTGGFDAVQAHLDRLAPWVDAINATDNAAAHAHCSNVAMAVAMARLGAEPIMQVVCRDKNRLALQSDIVGASMFGVENICCLTGDDVTAGDEPQARRVFDLDGPQLVRLATTLSQRDVPVRPPAGPAADPVRRRGREPRRAAVRLPRRADRQEAAGRRPVLPAADLLPPGPARGVHARGRPARRRRPRPRSCRRSAWCGGRARCGSCTTTCPASTCPAETIRRVESASDQREEAYQVVLEQARHALAQPGVRGLHITDFRHDDSVGRIVSDLGLVDRHAQKPANRTDEENDAHGSELAV